MHEAGSPGADDVAWGLAIIRNDLGGELQFGALAERASRNDPTVAASYQALATDLSRAMD